MHTHSHRHQSGVTLIVALRDVTRLQHTSVSTYLIKLIVYNCLPLQDESSMDLLLILELFFAHILRAARKTIYALKRKPSCYMEDWRMQLVFSLFKQKRIASLIPFIRAFRHVKTVGYCYISDFKSKILPKKISLTLKGHWNKYHWSLPSE